MAQVMPQARDEQSVNKKSAEALLSYLHPEHPQVSPVHCQLSPQVQGLQLQLGLLQPFVSLRVSMLFVISKTIFTLKSYG